MDRCRGRLSGNAAAATTIGVSQDAVPSQGEDIFKVQTHPCCLYSALSGCLGSESYGEAQRRWVWETMVRSWADW